MKWKGIKAIRTEATEHLVFKGEEDWLFYSAPEGYKLILSGVAVIPPTWKREIKDFGLKIDASSRKDRIFIRGVEGSGTMCTDDEKPVLELVKISEGPTDQDLYHDEIH